MIEPVCKLNSIILMIRPIVFTIVRIILYYIILSIYLFFSFLFFVLEPFFSVIKVSNSHFVGFVVVTQRNTTAAF
jgi:hypothetical protein